MVSSFEKNEIFMKIIEITVLMYRVYIFNPLLRQSDFLNKLYEIFSKCYRKISKIYFTNLLVAFLKIFLKKLHSYKLYTFTAPSPHAKYFFIFSYN